MSDLPEGYRYDRAARADVDTLIRCVRAWFPSASVGLGSRYLREQFFVDNVVLDEESDKDVFILLIRHGNEIVGFGSWERQPEALTLYARFGAVAPVFRGTARTSGMELTERIGRAMGAEFVYALATMSIPHVQLAAERAGFQLTGFFPGYDREEISPGVVKRVYEALYVKCLAPAQSFARPSEKNMTPTAKRLFDVVFPAETAPTTTTDSFEDESNQTLRSAGIAPER